MGAYQHVLKRLIYGYLDMDFMNLFPSTLRTRVRSLTGYSTTFDQIQTRFSLNDKILQHSPNDRSRRSKIDP